MISLTKKTGYGLIAMAHLAQRPRELCSAREIAEEFGVPTSLLMNVMKELAAAGYVESVRGARGGYRLARRPERISVADMVRTLEGPIRLSECVGGKVGDESVCTCEVMARCPIADPVHRVNRRLRDFLQQVTLAEMIEPAQPRRTRSRPKVSTARKEPSDGP